jgi:uncharacterized protein
LPRPFDSDDVLMSRVIAITSASFPEGENFFVRSVAHHRSELTDTGLKRQVGGFIGQEATHAREHRDINTRLHDLGYPTRFVDTPT